MHEVIDVVRRAHVLAVTFGAYACGIISLARDAAWLCTFVCTAMVIVPELLRWQTALRHLFRVAGIAALAGICAAWLAERNQLAPYSLLNDHHVIVRTVAIDRPRASDSGFSVRVRIRRVDEPHGAAARSLEHRVALLEVPTAAITRDIAGRELIVRARVEIPAGSRNEGERAQRDILADDGVALLLRAHGPRDVIVLAPASGAEAWWARLRQRCAAEVEARLPPLQATVLEGILWGDRGGLPAGLRQEFSDTGTVHVLVTAGLHLGMMAALIAGLVSLLPIPRVARATIVIAGAWIYASLAGLHLPTVRAATMLTAGILANEVGRARSPSAVLATAAFAVCLPHPLVLLSPSFAMSFACVCGIALLGPAFIALGLHESTGAARYAFELFRTSLVVQLGIWPYQALYFCAFTPYAVAANMLVVPLVGLTMACGSALVIFSLEMPPLAGAAANLTSWLLTWLIGIVERFARMPLAHVDVPPPNAAFLILYWMALAALAWAVAKKIPRRTLLSGAGIAAAVLVVAYAVPGIGAALDRHVRVDAIDVGQADCILIRAPGLHAMLIDGGGRLERTGLGAVVAQPIGDRIAARTVLPFLLRHWVLHLDAVILTHPHGDHAGGLPLILSRERVGALYDSAQPYGGLAYRRALEAARARSIRWIRATRGVTGRLGPGVRFRILAPEPPPIAGTSSDINNNSVVVRVEFGKIAMLFTGDAQAEAETRLLIHGAGYLRADVLKVGHHGSAYSSTPQFLAAVRPRVALISCGLHNVFGHPSPRTLEALRSIGAVTHRTDTEGGIGVITDGQRIWVRDPLEVKR